MIYQLAKTSTLLSGQVKWDLVMNKDKVTNLQIVPISEHIPYNYNSPVDVMNYSHGDNVKQLYNKIQGDFYSAKVNPNLSVFVCFASIQTALLFFIAIISNTVPAISVGSRYPREHLRNGHEAYGVSQILKTVLIFLSILV